MKKVIIVRLAIILMGLLNVQLVEVHAKKYQIKKLWNCKSIVIGEKKMKEGDYFSDGLTIHWTNSRQMMEIIEVPSGKITKIAKKGFDDHKAKSLWDFFTSVNSAGHRSFTNGHYYTENYYYLADSLHIPTMENADPNTISEAIWEYNGEQIVTPIQRTNDGKFYIITQAIYKNKEPGDVNLIIREREDGLDWINNVYQGIPITYIPTE